MQTFLPYADFTRTAYVLDRARLGKQRLENVTIMRALIGDGGYAHHPVTAQWAGFEYGLYRYHDAIVHEWVDVRGYKDVQRQRMDELYLPWMEENDPDAEARWKEERPKWLGDEEYHLAHQSRLLQKMPEYYLDIFPDTPDDLPNMYPSEHERFK